MPKKLLTALLCALMLGSNAYCDDSNANTGMKLLEWIKSDEKENPNMSDLFRSGLLLGHIDMASYLNGIVYSMPSGISRNQVVQILKKYLADHPKYLNFDLNLLIIRSLQEAYPLTKKDALEAISAIKADAKIP